MRVLTVGRPGSGPGVETVSPVRLAGPGRSALLLSGGLLVVAVAMAQLRGLPPAVAITAAGLGLFAAVATVLPAGVALLRRNPSMVLLVVLSALLIAWIAGGMIDAGRVWNPITFSPVGALLGRAGLSDGQPYPSGPIVWSGAFSWPWRFGGTPLWPLILAVICGGGGFVLIADAVRVAVGLVRPPRSRWRILTAPPTRGGQITLRVVPGVLLIGCGAFLEIGVLDGATAFHPVIQVLGVLGVSALSVLLVASPVVVGFSARLTIDRESLARDRERQRFAAHLHDSVLQTLALIQRQASEPEAVIRLASRQEHALRAWMAGEADLGSVTLTSAVREMLVEIEDEHGVRAELTVIGDAVLDARSEELVAAAREALRNVGRHAGGAAVNVFLDIGASGVELFVRDDGPGFDFDAVPVERRGLRDSVIGRMNSVGGSAMVDSSPGEGTEIALRLPAGGRS